MVSLSPVLRRKTHNVQVGSKGIGSDHPILVQSMTNTPTADIAATTAQVLELARAGSELVRMTVNTPEAARAVPHIRDRVAAAGLDVPLVGCFHFNGHALLQAEPACAEALAKYRINPGNVGKGENRDANFRTLVELACRYGKAIRIGANWGSLDQALRTALMDANTVGASADAIEREALVRSVLESAALARTCGLPADRIILSAKVSKVPDLVAVYRALASRCAYPLHLGLTEAGGGVKGIVATTTALAVLLHEGIGDTIRASLTPEPGQPRSQEVSVCQDVLQALGVRAFAPSITSCPGCGRTSSSFFQVLAADVRQFLQERNPEWQQHYPGVESMTVAVMGCVVNGPGESRHADIAISLPGDQEEPVAKIYRDGQPHPVLTLRGDTIAIRFKETIEDYVRRRFGPAFTANPSRGTLSCDTTPATPASATPTPEPPS